MGRHGRTIADGLGHRLFSDGGAVREFHLSADYHAVGAVGDGRRHRRVNFA